MTYTLRILFLLLFITFSSFIYGANYYWVGGSGKWSEYNVHWATTSGGSTFHVQVPTNLDNVYFDQNSGFTSSSKTITVDQTIVYCNDMNWTGALNSPVIVTTVSINTIKIFGSLTLIKAMFFNYTADISFEAQTTGKTITSNSQILNCRNLNFNGTGGGWSLIDSLTANNGIIHNAGTITTNSQVVTVGSYFSNSSAVQRTLNLGASVFKVKPQTAADPGTSHFSINPTNFVLNAGTSVIQFIGTVQGGFTGTGLSFNDLSSSPSAGLMLNLKSQVRFRKISLCGNSSISGDNSSIAPIIDSLVLFSGRKFLFEKCIKISTTGALVAKGDCSNPINIEPLYPNYVFYFIKSGNPVTVDYTTIRDARAQGGATFNATNSFNLGNVTGWNISNPTARNLYWVGGAGNWSDPLHWAITSGGTGGSGCIPFMSDNVYFDVNSGFAPASTVTMDMQLAFCKSMDWTGAPNTPKLAGPGANALCIAGSLTFIQNMNYTFTGNVTFSATSPGNTIATADKVFNCASLIFDGVGGGWALMDSLSGSNLTELRLLAGNLNTSNHNINIGTVSADMDAFGITYPVKVLTLGSSRVTLNSANTPWFLSNTNNLTLSAAASTIILTSAGGKSFITQNFIYNNVICLNGDMSVLASGSTFHKLVFSGSGSINGNNKYDTLSLAAGGVYGFEGGSFQYLLNGTLIANGTCAKPISISGNGQIFTFVKTSGTVDVNYVLLRENNATGGALFTSQNSFATTNVSGWVINPAAARNLYWVGGTGNWEDPNHWSLSSGGISGACIPGPEDNVYFDVNSFPFTGATVSLNAANNYCKNMNWTGALRSPAFSQYTSSRLSLYGNLTFIPAMSTSLNGSFEFGSATIADIYLAGKPIGIAYFTGNGTYHLLSSFTCRGFFLQSGKVYSNNFNITTTYSFFSLKSSLNSSDKNAIYLGSSNVTLANDIIADTKNLIFDAGTSTIIFTDAFDATIDISGWPYGLQFNRVISQHATKAFRSYGTHTYKKLTLQGPGIFEVECVMDTLELTPGRTYNFHADSTFIINNVLTATGTPGFPIELLSTVNGRQATLSKSTGILCLDYLFLKDIRATGGARFYAGQNGANISNNSGWFFADCYCTFTTSENKAVCLGANYTYPDGTIENNVTSATSHISTLTSKQGCDSTVTTNLSVTIVNPSVSQAGLTLTADQSSASYQWLDCNNGNSPLSMQTAQSYTPTMNGSYAVKITYNGCVETSSCTPIIVSSSLNSLDDYFSIYPNPATQSINISSEDVYEGEIEIRNISGVVVLQQQIDSNATLLDISTLPDGLYWVTVISSEGSAVKKISKITK